MSLRQNLTESNIDMQAVSKRRYPEFTVGDKIKIYRNKEEYIKRGLAYGCLHFTNEKIITSTGEEHFVQEGKEKRY